MLRDVWGCCGMWDAQGCKDDLGCSTLRDWVYGMLQDSRMFWDSGCLGMKDARGCWDALGCRMLKDWECRMLSDTQKCKDAEMLRDMGFLRM